MFAHHIRNPPQSFNGKDYRSYVHQLGEASFKSANSSCKFLSFILIFSSRFSAFAFCWFVFNLRIIFVLTCIFKLIQSICNRRWQTLLSKRVFQTENRCRFCKIQNDINRLKQSISKFQVFLKNVKTSFSNFLV